VRHAKMTRQLDKYYLLRMENFSSKITVKGLIIILFTRLFLFAVFQAIIAIFISSWIDSEKFWLLTATLTNVVSIVILKVLLKKEGKKYLTLFRFSKKQRGKDFMIFLVPALICLPVILIPSLSLSQWLWGNTAYYHQVLFRQIPKEIIYFLLLVFPITAALAEIPTYFGYIMPRLKDRLRLNWVAFVLPVIFLSVQNCALPLVFDAKFILFRGLMYLPYALLLGIFLFKRSSLLPYVSILYGMIYLLPVIMLLTHKY
jgi:hypothetical protein